MSMSTDPAACCRASFLRDVEPEHLQPFLPRMRVRDLPRHACLFRQGEDSDPAYVVVSGQVRISVLTAGGAEMTLDVLGPGDACGVAGLAGPFPRISNAQALQPSRVLVIPTAVLRTLMEKHPNVFHHLLRQLLRRLARSIQEQVAGGTQRVYARVAQKLLSLSENCSQDGRTRALPSGLSHQELARMVGSTRATVTRVLQEMRRQGILDDDPHRRQIVIREVDRLLEFSEGTDLMETPGITVFP